MSSSDSLLETSNSDSEHECINIKRRKVHKPRVVNFNEWSDQEFFNRFRLSKKAVIRLLNLIRDRISSPLNRGGAIKPEAKLLLTLRFYATGNLLISVADFVGVSVAFASRIVKHVSDVIASLRPDFIEMPKTQEQLKQTALEFSNISQFPTCCGVIDCTHIRIISPGGDDAEIFRNRKGYFSLNVQTVCDAKLKIKNIVARWPGSCHNQRIFNNSNLKQEFENGIFNPFRLIGGSGYALRSYLFTPFKKPQSQAQEFYNKALICTRNTVERQHVVWKRRFPILSLGIQLDVNTSMTIIVATAVLHNLAIEMNDVLPETEDEEYEKDNHNNGKHDRAPDVRNVFIDQYFTV